MSTKSDFAASVNKSNRVQIWSCGGGTQSVAIGILIIQGRLPKPDLAAIADTGKEKATTWGYYERWLKPGLAAVGVDIARVNKEEYCANWGRDVWATNGDLLIPAFTTVNGNVSKLPGYCSKAWKSEVVRNWATRVHGIRVGKTRKWLGFSIDEPKRYIDKIGLDEVWFPLVDGMPLSRAQCVRLVEEHGWPTPPRSSCWMCPNNRDETWAQMKERQPDEFEAACRMDEELRLKDPHIWLHESGTPLRSVTFTSRNQPEQCTFGECFT